MIIIVIVFFLNFDLSKQINKEETRVVKTIMFTILNGQYLGVLGAT